MINEDEMKYETLIIENKEYDQLKQIISSAQNKIDQTYKASIEKLLNELKHAQFLNIKKMPIDVVRFNSVVTIRDPYRNIRSYEIVKPERSNIAENKISVLAPMGLALFGYAKDDEILWQFPSGLQAIKILKVEQPIAVKKIV